jgi:DNA-binding transcriptional ArsR family regulator
MSDNGHIKDNQSLKAHDTKAPTNDFVLEKSIFSNIFEKDIRRVYIYKKAERLAKAIHLVAPAFRNSPALRDRMDHVAVGLVDAAILPPTSARDALSRELLALSSVLSIGRTGGLLSSMNAELIAREAQTLLQEVAAYEEPRLFLDDAPSLAELAKELAAERHAPSVFTPRIIPAVRVPRMQRVESSAPPSTPKQGSGSKGQDKGHISDKTTDRREAILSILRSKGPSYIKDVSTVIRDVSEKTIQRELQALAEEGTVIRTGERRWTTYAIA